MIREKILSTLISTSLLMSVVAIAPVYAAPTSTEPISVEYVNTNDATTRQVNFYYTGSITEAGTYGFQINILLGINTASKATITAGTPTASYWSDVSVDTYNIATGRIGIIGYTEADDPVYTSDNLLATLILTVPEDTADFDLTVKSTSYVTDGEWSDILPSDDIVITIPGAGGGNTKVDFKGSEALTSTRFADDTSSVPVDAWSTTINWANYKPAQLYWSISNGSRTVKKPAKMADVTGGIETVVTYGLAIAGRADELDTITEVKLVVE